MTGYTFDDCCAALRDEESFVKDVTIAYRNFGRTEPVAPLTAVSVSVVPSDEYLKLKADHAEAAQLRADLAAQQRVNTTYAERIHKYRTRAADAATELESMHGRLADAEKTISELSDRLRKRTAALNELESTADESRQRARESEDAYARLYAEASQMRGHLEETEAAYARQFARLAEVTEERDTLDRAHRRVIDGLVEERRQLNKRLDFAETARKAANAQAGRARDKNRKLEHALTLGRPEITLYRRNGFTREVRIATAEHTIVAHVHREEITGNGQRIDDAGGVTTEVTVDARE